MSFIITSKTQQAYSQLRDNTRIREQSHHIDGLETAIVVDRGWGQDLVGDAIVTQSGGWVGSERNGLTLSSKHFGSTSYWDVANIPHSSKATWLFALYADSSNNYASVFDGDATVHSETFSANRGYSSLKSSTNGNNWIHVQKAFASTSELGYLVISVDGASAPYATMRGANGSIRTDTGAAPTRTTTGLTNMRFGAWYNSTAAGPAVDLLFFAKLNDYWDTAKQVDWINNPFQIFENQSNRTIFLPAAASTGGYWPKSYWPGAYWPGEYWPSPEAAAGAGVTIQSPVGSATFTAKVPTTATGVLAAAPVGSLTFTAQTPTVATGVAIQSPVGSLTFTAQTPSTATGVAADAPVGSITFTAQTPSTATGVSVVSPAAAVTFTAQTPTIATGGTIQSPVGSITFTAQTPSTATGVSVVSPAAAVTFTAQTSTVATGAAVQAPVGSITFTAQTSTVATGVNVVSPAAAITFAARTSTVAASENIAAPVGSITFTAQTSTVATGASVVSPAGAITFTAQLPSVASGFIAQAPVGSIVVTGVVPEASLAVAAPSGTLTYTAQLPSLLTGVALTSPAAAITITAQLPGVAASDGLARILAPSAAMQVTATIPATQIALVDEVFSPTVVYATLAAAPTVGAPAFNSTTTVLSDSHNVAARAPTVKRDDSTAARPFSRRST